MARLRRAHLLLVLLAVGLPELLRQVAQLLLRRRPERAQQAEVGHAAFLRGDRLLAVEVLVHSLELAAHRRLGIVVGGAERRGGAAVQPDRAARRVLVGERDELPLQRHRLDGGGGHVGHECVEQQLGEEEEVLEHDEHHEAHVRRLAVGSLPKWGALRRVVRCVVCCMVCCGVRCEAA